MVGSRLLFFIFVRVHETSMQYEYSIVEHFKVIDDGSSPFFCCCGII